MRESQRNFGLIKIRQVYISSLLTSAVAILLLGMTEPVSTSKPTRLASLKQNQIKKQSLNQNRTQPKTKKLLSPKIQSNNSKTVQKFSQVSPKALALIKEFEGFSPTAYQDTNGVLVIGYGQPQIKGQQVKHNDRISPTEAEAALKLKVQAIQQQLLTVVQVPVNSHQLAALTSLVFNAGFPAIAESTLLQTLNAGDYTSAADEFLRWNKADFGNGRLVPMAGLTRRRQAERNLFLLPVEQ